ncbi:MAG TPA: aspartate ammonia-lyase [Chloroflexi bacterium]|jgi:fumarate hydratase class II|nr:aspartate ammonia-lyase [Chloroflexota bacterium]
MRTETDSLGPVAVPDEALWGAQTQRAVHNFPISGLRQPDIYLRVTAMVKQAAAEVNVALGQLDPALGAAIAAAAAEIVAGRWHEQFVVDPFQAGAGTSHNMNANEVIANLANEALGGQRGTYRPVHPNDHVNMAQSTNDVIPTVVRVAAALLVRDLLPVIEALADALERKAQAFDAVLKPGRTHLQDAVPVRLGQEFAAYALAVRRDGAHIAAAAEGVHRLGIGGTATGTGLNSHPDFHAAMVAKLSALAGIAFHSSGNLFESMQSAADLAHLSGALRTLALTLTRIANDLRLLSSGPTTGLGEITLPAVQPGSSIMPGKVNPVMAEMLNMVCFHVIGNDQTIAMATQAGQLELNVMMPIIAYNLLQSLAILTSSIRVFTEACVAGIEANVERCRRLAEGSIGLATALNAHIGYAAAAKVAQEALARGVSLRQVVLEHGYLSAERLDAILDPFAMTEPGIPGGEAALEA